MKSYNIIIGLLIVSLLKFGVQAQSKLQLCRENFHQVNDQDGLESIINMNTENSSSFDQNILQAYRGVSICMLASYTFSPFSKYRYFREGKNLIENSIKNEVSLENIYLRLLVQLSTPGILNYHNEIKSDLEYFRKNLSGTELTVSEKKLFIKTLLGTGNTDYDLIILKKIEID